MVLHYNVNIIIRNGYIKFHTAAKPGVKRKSNKDAQNKNNEKYEAYRKQLFLSSWATDGYKYKMTTKKE
jgi:hypothetical protein